MSTASDIVAGLGGQENITDLEPCITRLRVEVADQAKVDEEALRAAGAFGVVRSGRVVQVVVGPTADTLASEIASLWHRPALGRPAGRSAPAPTCLGPSPASGRLIDDDGVRFRGVDAWREKGGTERSAVSPIVSPTSQPTVRS